MINEILEQRNLCDTVQKEKPEEMASCEKMITQFVETYPTPFILRESENFYSTLPVAMKYN